MLLNRVKPSRAQVAAVKAWVAELLPVQTDSSLLVTELECREEGCPPIETLIASLADGQPPQQWNLHKPIAAIVRDDIALLATAAGSCGIRGWRCPD